MSKARAEPIITGADFTVDVTVPETGRAFTLRAPTFADAGRLAAAAAAELHPNQAVFNDVLREAIRRTGLPEAEQAAHIAAVDQAEETDDHLSALYAAHGTDSAAWPDDTRREMAEAQRAALAAQRAKARAEWATRADEKLTDLRRYQSDFARRDQVGLLRMCLVPAPAPEAIEAMPAIEVGTLYRRALDLLRPSPAAEKN